MTKQITFRKFTDDDYQTFGGVDPKSDPFIAEWEEEDEFETAYALIVAGDSVSLLKSDYSLSNQPREAHRAFGNSAEAKQVANRLVQVYEKLGERTFQILAWPLLEPVYLTPGSRIVCSNTLDMNVTDQ